MIVLVSMAAAPAASLVAVGIPQMSAGARVDLTGWLKFAGEFEIYPQRPRFGNVGCVSGNVQSPVLYRRAKRLVDRRVRVSGQAIRWTSDTYALTWGRSTIENFCYGPFVILIDSISAVR